MQLPLILPDSRRVSNDPRPQPPSNLSAMFPFACLRLLEASLDHDLTRSATLADRGKGTCSIDVRLV